MGSSSLLQLNSQVRSVLLQSILCIKLTDPDGSLTLIGSCFEPPPPGQSPSINLHFNAFRYLFLA